MIFNKTGMIIFFLSAYIPVFLLISIVYFLYDYYLFVTSKITFDCNIILLIFILLIVSIAVISILHFILKRLNGLIKKDSFETEVKITETNNNDYIIFILTYLVPFLNVTDIKTFLGFLVVFVLIGYLYITTSLFTINPTLKILWKYNLYKGINNDINITIITKNKITNGLHSFKLINLSDNVYMGVLNE